MIDEFLTITDCIGEGFYSEKRSKFLAFAIHLTSIDEVKKVLNSYRKKYYDARHICYAYMLGAERQTFRVNDDGEPSNTAGKPILGQINSKNLTDVLVIVVRYYGGVNLGTGGLIVAYRAAAADAISHSEIVKKKVEVLVRYAFDYPMLNNVMHVVKKFSARIVEQKFDNTCTIILAIQPSQLKLIKSQLDQLKF